MPTIRLKDLEDPEELSADDAAFEELVERRRKVGVEVKLKKIPPSEEKTDGEA